MEKQHTALQSELEKDKALYEDKLNFISLQKTRLEADKLECEKRLKEEQEIKAALEKEKKYNKYLRPGAAEHTFHTPQQFPQQRAPLLL